MAKLPDKRRNRNASLPRALSWEWKTLPPTNPFDGELVGSDGAASWAYLVTESPPYKGRSFQLLAPDGRSIATFISDGPARSTCTCGKEPDCIHIAALSSLIAARQIPERRSSS